MNVHAQAAGWPRTERASDGVEYLVRPLCRNDVALEREFILGLSPESRFQRFMHAIGEPSDEFIAHLLFEHAKREGFRSIYGHVLADNQRMIELAEWLGLRLEPAEPHQTVVRASLRLN